jgi:hypothetical protein
MMIMAVTATETPEIDRTVDRMTVEQYRLERARIRAEDTSHPDQAVALLWVRSRWTPADIASEESRTVRMAELKLRFGRFLVFAAETAAETLGLATLNESRFRELWVQTDRESDETGRFQGVLHLLEQGEPPMINRPRSAKPSAKSAKSASMSASTAYADNVKAEVQARIDKVCNQPLTMEGLAQQWGVHITLARRYLREAALYGMVTKQGDLFTVRPYVRSRSAAQVWARDLLREIQRQRKANHDQRGRRAWNPYGIDPTQQSALLDSIEVQLNKVALNET